MKLSIPLLIPLKKAEESFKANIRFKTRAKVTPRTVKLAEAFGLGIDEEHEFVIYDNFNIEINKGDIVYITGDSGSGKSLLLMQLRKRLTEYPVFGRIVTDREIEKQIDPEKPLIEQVGQDLREGINVLSMVGLNEAFLMLRKYSELSDGQKYRFKIAKMIDSNSDVWIMDEFLALLDRITARVVAYTIQKAARKLGKTVLVATTHCDLKRDLNPTATVTKRFGSNVDIQYDNVRPSAECSLLGKISIEEGSNEDYAKLEQFHYRKGRLAWVRAIYRAVYENTTIGVIVYGAPYPNLAARRIVLPMFSRKLDSKHMRRINKNFIRIWRVVVEPKFRSIGLGVKLIRDTMSLVGCPYVEIMAVMGQYNPFAVKAGMLNVPMELYSTHSNSYRAALLRIEELGFDLDFLRSVRHNHECINRLSPKEIRELKSITYRHFMGIIHGSRKDLVKELDRADRYTLAKLLSNYRLPYAYAIWKNPRFTRLPDPCLPRC